MRIGLSMFAGYDLVDNVRLCAAYNGDASERVEKLDFRTGRFRPTTDVDKCATRATGTLPRERFSPLALSWPNRPCALKAAIGFGKRTLGHPRQSAAPQGPRQGPIAGPGRPSWPPNTRVMIGPSSPAAVEHPTPASGRVHAMARWGTPS
jgi:hypothetical protein